MSIYDEIAAERARQIAKGFDAAHDDEHGAGEIAAAAACYAYPLDLVTVSDMSMVLALPEGRIPVIWPWEDRWWRPGTRREDLVKAAALLVAEIERLDRASKDLNPYPVDEGC